MKKDEIQISINKVLPNLYRFAVAITPNKLLAEQSVLDAVTVYLVENKEFLEREDSDLDTTEGRVSFYRYLTDQLLVEVYENILRKSQLESQTQSASNPEFEEYFKLSIKERSILYLKEIQNMPLDKIQVFFSIKYHELIQLFYNAKSKLLRDIGGDHELENFMQQVSSSRNSHLVNSLVYETYGYDHQKDHIEKLIMADEDLRHYFASKQNERDFLKQLIPDISLKKLDLPRLRRAVFAVISDVYPEGSFGLFRKVKKVLNKPLFKIEI